MTGLPAYGSLLIPGNGVDVYDVLSKYNNCAGFGVALIDRSGPENRVELDSNGEAQLKYNRTPSPCDFTFGPQTYTDHFTV